LGLAGLLVYAALVLRFPISRYAAIPRASVSSATNGSPTAAFLIACAGILLHATYVAAVLLCWRSERGERWAMPLLWGYALAAAALLMLLWPVNSTDLFDYIFRGRMAAAYGDNPYLVLPNRHRNDPLFNFIGWPNAPSAYGPLWELISARLSAIGGTSIQLNLFLQKGLALLTFLLCGVVIVLMDRPDGDGNRLLSGAIWLWSPLALWEIVGMGHNDGLLVLSMLLALWAVSRGHYRWATVALVTGALFKFLPAILLPLVFVHGARRESWPARFRLAVEMGLIAAVMVVLAYLPYWQGWNTLSNITVREKFLNAAPLAILTHTLSQWWSIDMVRPKVASAGSALLAVGLLWQMWHIWRYGRDLRTAFFGVLAWYLIVASQWFQPWYVLWLLALVAVRPARDTFGWVEAWALSAQSSYLLQFFFLRWLKWPGNQLPAQRLYLLMIFGPPLVVWGIQRWRRPSRPADVRQPGQALPA
jgi:hypothetical protein